LCTDSHISFAVVRGMTAIVCALEDRQLMPNAESASPNSNRRMRVALPRPEAIFAVTRLGTRLRVSPLMSAVIVIAIVASSVGALQILFPISGFERALRLIV